MIDATFIQAVTTLAQQAITPKLLPVNDDQQIMLIDGKRVDLAIDPPRRKHVAKDLSAIVAFAKDAANVADVSPSVWFSQAGAVCLIDDEIRRDEIRLKLEFSPQFNQLCNWINGQTNTLKQDKAVLLLRTMFRDCLGQAGDLLNILKRLKFVNNVSGGSNIAHGKASLSKNIEQEITGDASIPEFFTLVLPIFASAFVSVQNIEVAIHIDCATESFTFIPIPGACAKAIELAEADIGKALADMLGDGVKLYYGSP